MRNYNFPSNKLINILKRKQMVVCPQWPFFSLHTDFKDNGREGVCVLCFECRFCACLMCLCYMRLRINYTAHTLPPLSTVAFASERLIQRYTPYAHILSYFRYSCVLECVMRRIGDQIFGMSKSYHHFCIRST